MAETITTNAMPATAADSSASTIYRTTESPEDLIATYCQDAAASDPPPAKATYGLDSPLGLAMSNVAAPLYLYASLKGKFDLWDRLLAEVPPDVLRQPSLDVGCGRGLVLLKVAQRKQALAPSDGPAAKAYGIDVFVKGDQTGNAPAVTAGNAAALGVAPQVALHNANFTKPLPFAAGAFGLVTASLALHNADEGGRKDAMREIIRVCRPDARLVVVDLMGYVRGLRAQLREAGWPDEGIAVTWAGPGVMFGMWPTQVLTATCPSES